MTALPTVPAADAYWQRHYAGPFRFGEGTEDVLAALTHLPPVASWADLGSGAESLLWASALNAGRLTAVDTDSARLAHLTRFVARARPRPVHRTALALCSHTGPSAFTERCRSLSAAVVADCLTGRPPAHPALAVGRFDLVTQFGLLGLTNGPAHFARCFEALHQLLAPGGWCAGANWEARDRTGRVRLDWALFQYAARCGITFTTLRRVRSADPDFPAVWLYTGRSTR